MSVHHLDTGYDPDAGRPEGDTLQTMAEKVPGLTYRCLDYWTRTGLLQMARDAQGSGTPRVWAPGEAEVLRKVLPLTRAGIHPAIAFQLARHGHLSAAPNALLRYEYLEEVTDADGS